MQDFMFTNSTSFKGKFLALFFVIFFLLTLGMFTYHFSEGWSYVDSLYFSASSLTTRGYNYMYPTTVFTKLFTVFYLFIGVALVLYSLSSLIANFMRFHEPAISQKVDRFMKKVSPEKKDKWVILKNQNNDNDSRGFFKR